MNTYEILKQLVDNMYDKRDDPQYDGDYTATLTSEGLSASLAVNSIEFELIDEDEILIHLNVINVKD